MNDYREGDNWGGSSQTHKLFGRPSLGEEKKARSYILTVSIIERLDRLARKLKVGQSDLVRFLLKIGLDQVESGRVKVPTRRLPGRYIADDGLGDA